MCGTGAAVTGRQHGMHIYPENETSISSFRLPAFLRLRWPNGRSLLFRYRSITHCPFFFYFPLPSIGVYGPLQLNVDLSHRGDPNEPPPVSSDNAFFEPFYAVLSCAHFVHIISCFLL